MFVDYFNIYRLIRPPFGSQKESGLVPKVRLLSFIRNILVIFFSEASVLASPAAQLLVCHDLDQIFEPLAR